MIVYLNGRFLPREEAKISPEDRGFLFADAIYEVVRYGAGRPYRLAEHLARMRDGLTALRLAVDPSFFPEVAGRLVAENDLEEGDALVYVQVSRGAAPRYHAFPPEGTPPTVFAFARKTDPPPPPGGGRAILLPDERWGRCDIKTVGLLPNVLAKQAAREKGAAEAWMVDEMGLVTEGSSTNAWIVDENGKLRTRDSQSNILRGITRTAVLRLIEDEGLEFEERAFSVDEAKRAKEAFYTSASGFVMPAVSIDGTKIGNGKPGPIATRLRTLYLDQAIRDAI